MQWSHPCNLPLLINGMIDKWPKYSGHFLANSTNYGHLMAKSLILCSPNSNPKPKWIFGMWSYKGLVFCRNNGWMMKNMDKGLTFPKWMLIIWHKIPQMPQTLSTQFVCPSPKVLDFNEKEVSWDVPSPCLEGYTILKHENPISPDLHCKLPNCRTFESPGL